MKPKTGEKIMVDDKFEKLSGLLRVWELRAGDWLAEANKADAAYDTLTAAELLTRAESLLKHIKEVNHILKSV